ncbi:VOC family protein [Pollutibacter soli]|uniref:VOC family protein n=1 Tax=Pollutibacter soli TaxID=3034157 RepID=UPI003013E2F1
MATVQKITPNLWFANEAEDAAKFYVSVFDNSSMGDITTYTAAGQEIHKMKPGSVMTVEFTLDGQRFIALNGGPVFKFNESVSFVVTCETQEEIDYYWNKLSEGGDPHAQVCGWLKDKFGLSWQVVPSMLDKLFTSKNREKKSHVMEVMMKMKKLDIAELERAAEGELA